MHVPTWFRTGTAVTVAAAAATAATNPSTRWYRGLRKPRWQPPSAALPAVWTPLYVLIAVAGARVLDRSDAAARTSFIRAYGLNLALNAGWTLVFFRAQKPSLALAEIGVLNASNVALLRRAARVDGLAAAALTPYVGWTLFATALNIAIVRLND